MALKFVLLTAMTFLLTSAAVPNYCDLPQDSGPCYGYFPRFYFDTSSKKCKKFIYGGCQGNENNFKSFYECKAACVCTQDVDYGQKEGVAVDRFFYNVSEAVCKSFNYKGSGGNGNRFMDDTECQHVCATSFCFLPPETGPCKAHMEMFFYNKTSQKCESFIYGGCHGNKNRFEKEDECNQKCTAPIKEKSEICNLPVDKGPCDAIMKRFFYNSTSCQCEEFDYGGCKGNGNRFETKKECVAFCGSPTLLKG